MRRAREQGLSLTGPDGLLKQLTKTVLETALNEEMTEHLGYEKHGQPTGESGNIRNGTRSKTVLPIQRPGRDRRAAGSGRHVHPSDSEEAAAPSQWCGRDRAVVVRQGADHRGATGQLTTPASYSEEIHTLFDQSDAERILAHYPVEQFRSAGEALSAVVTDWAWGCPVLHRDRALAVQTPLYAYEFADETAPWFTALPKPNFPTGAFHGAELQYLFTDEQLPGPSTPPQEQLSATMMRY